MNREWCSAVAGGIRLGVQVVPNARKSEVAGIVGDAVKIRLAAQPIDGKANETLLRFIADRLGVSASSVHLTHGHTGRRKTVRVDAPNLAVDSVREALLKDT